MTGSLDLSAIDGSIVDGRSKGFPLDAPAMRLDAIGQQGWNLLRGDLPAPAAVIRAGALAGNVAFMRDFAAASGLAFAPHGKTSMCPHLLQMQLHAGAWGITFASVQQASVAIAIGLRRVLIANQVVAPRDIAGLAALMARHADLEIYVLADSLSGISRLDAGMARPLGVLVEIGHAGGRCGARTAAEALSLCEAVAASRHLRLAGLECYEGLALSGEDAADRSHVAALLGQLAQIAQAADGRGLFAGAQIILSAGGSAAFDLVAAALPRQLSRPVLPLLRSGCVVTHDHGFFARMYRNIRARGGVAAPGGLQAALEVWSVVLSRPEPGLAILALGKRDISSDLDLPQPRWHSRGGDAPAPAPPEWRIAKLNDQHAHVVLPTDADLAVGDLVGCGLSHPCTTFDKWDLIHLIDDGHNVVGAVRTFF